MIRPEHGVLPVIHIQSVEHAIDTTGLVFEVGAGGVVLIDHRSYDSALLEEATNAVLDLFPDKWVGVNVLQLFAREAVQWAGEMGCAGVWVDNAAEPDVSQTDQESIEQSRTDHGLMYFGGIAMKGSGYVEDPLRAAEKIKTFMGRVDVVVTSGPGTGVSTTTERLSAVRAAIGNKPLAVASGVNADNISAQSPYLDYVLVASSIERRRMSGDIDPAKLRELIEKFIGFTRSNG